MLFKTCRVPLRMKPDPMLRGYAYPERNQIIFNNQERENEWDLNSEERINGAWYSSIKAKQ